MGSVAEPRVVTIGVSDALPRAEQATVVASLFVPDVLVDDGPVRVAFAYPGGGYARHYYDLAPGDPDGSQARHHAAAGVVFVAFDHLGVGDSSPVPTADWDADTMVAANHEAAVAVRSRLVSGELDARLAGRDLRFIGMGQSMGGYLLTLHQARSGFFDAVAMLGWSAIREAVPDAPAGAADVSAPTDRHPLTFAFHDEDEDAQLVDQDMVGFPERGTPRPRWATPAIPPFAFGLSEPGIVAVEAATISVPVFVGMGARDFCLDPRAEPRAYPQSRDVTVYVLERSAHMHNFATTRSQLWARLGAWVSSVT